MTVVKSLTVSNGRIVTGSNGTVDTADITASAVTFAKMQGIAAYSVVGNPTDSSAAPTAIAADPMYGGAVLGFSPGDQQIAWIQAVGGSFLVSVTETGVELQSIPLVVGLGGTGATTAADARTNLGLAIGTNVQAYDGDLTALAALSGTGLAVRTAANTWVLRSIAGTTDKITVTNGDGVSGNPTITIASTYVGQTSITTLGTITTGTWSAGEITATGSNSSGITLNNATTSSSDTVLSLAHNSSGTPANGFGGGLRLNLESSTTADQQAGLIQWTWTEATHASRKGKVSLQAADAAGSREGVVVGTNGSAALVGFFGVTPVAQQTGDLMTGLTNLGLFTSPTLVPVVHMQDQKAQNTQGGTFTSGAWRTRDLNTEVSDSAGICSLSSNQFTLSAGTYEILARAPGVLVDRHQLRLRNVTDGTTLLTGSSAYCQAANGVVTDAWLMGVFTIGSGKALELQHQCSATQATVGFGNAANFTTEVYAEVFLRKIG